MHIKIILLNKTFVKFFTKWTCSVILLVIIGVFRYFDKLVFNWFNFISFGRVFRLYILISFWLDWLFIKISIISIPTVHLLLNCFDYLRTNIFQKWLNSLITNLFSNQTNCVDSWCSYFIIFVINIFHNIS